MKHVPWNVNSRDGNDLPLCKLHCLLRPCSHTLPFSGAEIRVCSWLQALDNDPLPTEHESPPHLPCCPLAVLLEACGGYFSKGSAGRKLDRFLAHLQRYLLAKPPLPLDVEFDVQVRGRGSRPGVGVLVGAPSDVPNDASRVSASC